MTETASPLIVWVGPAFTLLGTVVAYDKWITNNRLSLKDDRIAELKRNFEMAQKEKKQLESEINKATKDADAAYDALSETLSRLREQDLGAEDIVRLNRILHYIGGLGNWQSELNDYKIAAKALQNNKKNLVKEAVRHASKIHSSAISSLKTPFPWKNKKLKQRFEENVSAYLDWVYECLYVSGHPDNNPLTRFVKNPIFSVSAPYLIAIEYVKNNGDWNYLSIDQTRYLHGMLQELITKLQKELEA